MQAADGEVHMLWRRRRQASQGAGHVTRAVPYSLMAYRSGGVLVKKWIRYRNRRQTDGRVTDGNATLKRLRIG